MLSELVIRVANLVEAEGRAARRGASEVGVSLCIYVGSTLLTVAGLIAVGVAVFTGLVAAGLHRGWAYLVLGLLLLGVAAGGAFAARRLARGGKATG